MASTALGVAIRRSRCTLSTPSYSATSYRVLNGIVAIPKGQLTTENAALKNGETGQRTALCALKTLSPQKIAASEKLPLTRSCL